MFRISNRMMYNNTLINAFRNNEGLLGAQEQISSGKRINRPSDDPAGMMDVLELRTQIGKAGQYLKVIDNSESVLNRADSTIGATHDALKEAKELAIQQSQSTVSADLRQTAAVKVDNLIDQLVSYGNTKLGGKYIFSGQQSDQPAVSATGAYTGSGKDLKLEITEGMEIAISVRASEFLTTDMNPALSVAANATTLASLNGGTGVPVGTFDVTDRAGNTMTVDTTGMTYVQEVEAAITAGAPNITVTTDGTGLIFTDNNPTPIQAMSVTSTATSQALGIAGTWNSSAITGDDLDPTVTDTTVIGDLYGGVTGAFALNDIVLRNGGASATVTLSTLTTANTVGDIRTAINAVGGAMADTVTASIDAAGRGLTLASGNAATVASAFDPAAGKSAALMGIGGGNNAIPVLQKLSAALKANDQNGILDALSLLDSAMDTTNSVRGKVGAVTGQVISTRSAVEQTEFDSTRIKSTVEDTDFLKAASELAMLQTAYQATLKSSAAIIQPSLLDFV